jgi:siroheme synthase-like protein
MADRAVPRDYPIVLRLKDRPCLVVGGGPVAEGKVAGLLAAGARVKVLSPTLTPALERWAAAARIDHQARRYQAGDVVGHALAFVAAGDRAVAAAVAQDGREHGVWVNAADDPIHCDFILPSVLRRGQLTVAVSTGGASPALARLIREELEGHLGDVYGALVELAADVRRDVRQRSEAPPPAAWRHALDPELRRLIAAGRREEAEMILRKHLAEGLASEGA